MSHYQSVKVAKIKGTGRNYKLFEQSPDSNQSYIKVVQKQQEDDTKEQMLYDRCSLLEHKLYDAT